MDEVMEVIRNRVSLRKYADRPVSPEHLDLILESAMRAPTAGNMMLYSIIEIEDPEKKRALSETCDHQPFIAQAPVVLVFLADYQRWFDYYAASGVHQFCRDRGNTFTGPDEADLLLACCDALIAAENAVIAAESLGIGSCYIGDIMENYEIHRELLGLPSWAFPITMLCLGYYPEGHRPPPRSRFHKEFIVQKEAYRRLSEDDLNRMLAEEVSHFPSNNSHGAANYGQFFYARKTGSDFAREMARSVREALKNWRGEALPAPSDIDGGFPK